MSTNWVRKVALLSLLAVAGVALGGPLTHIYCSGYLPGVDSHGSLDWNNKGHQKFTGVYHSHTGIMVCLGKGNVENESCRYQCYNNSGLGDWVLDDCGYDGITCVEKYIVQRVTAAQKRHQRYWVCDTYCGGFKDCSPNDDDDDS